MTIRMVCDGCQKVIAANGAFQELADSENRQRHYHANTCWPSVRQAIRDAEQTLTANPPSPPG